MFAFAAIFYAELSWPLRLLLALLIVIYSGYCWMGQQRQRGVLQWRSDWRWQGADNIERKLQLRQFTVWPGLIVLAFADMQSGDVRRGKKFVLTLLADSFKNATNDLNASDDARRLRVHLNHFPVFDSSAD